MNGPNAETGARAAVEMMWDAWGISAGRKPLSPAVVHLLQQVFGISGEVSARRDEGGVPLDPPALTAAEQAQLSALAEVSVTHHDRLLHAGGKSTFDLLRRRAAGAQAVPDAVVFPASHDETLAVLRWCAGADVAVVPFGGGTSVVGGVDPERGSHHAVVAVSLRRLNQLHAIDEASATATFGAGTTGPQAEELLAAHNLSLGHFPQSFQFASLGGFAAARSSGQASAGYGRFNDMVTRLRVATPSGDLDLGRAPASAAGPDLRQLFLGSEGTLGIITEVTVRVHPVPAVTRYQAWSFPEFAAGADALRHVAQSGLTPTVMRLSDEAETGVNLARAKDIGGAPVSGCLAIATFEGTAASADARAAATAAIFAAAGGTDLGPGPAEEWSHGRFSAPYLRDELLDVGVLCETLETATSWSELNQLRQQVTAALTAALDGPVLVLCHISHTYPAGASLYFTVIARQSTDPLLQWATAKHAASDALAAAGATLSHHHGVGADHRPWMTAEIGELGVAVLRAIKNTVDPTAIMNPGKLIP